jgi:hypothetical protein
MSGRSRHPFPPPIDDRQGSRPVGRRPPTTDGRKTVTLGRIARSCLVHVWCRSCLHIANIPVEQLLGCHGPDLPLESLRRRSTCSRCGQRNANLQVVPDIPPVRPTTTVTLNRGVD